MEGGGGGVEWGGGGVAFTDPCAHKKEVWVPVSSVCIFSEERSGTGCLLDASVQSCHERWTVQREHPNNPHRR